MKFATFWSSSTTRIRMQPPLAERLHSSVAEPPRPANSAEKTRKHESDRSGPRTKDQSTSDEIGVAANAAGGGRREQIVDAVQLRGAVVVRPHSVEGVAVE